MPVPRDGADTGLRLDSGISRGERPLFQQFLRAEAGVRQGETGWRRFCRGRETPVFRPKAYAGVRYRKSQRAGRVPAIGIRRGASDPSPLRGLAQRGTVPGTPLAALAPARATLPPAPSELGRSRKVHRGDRAVHLRRGSPPATGQSTCDRAVRPQPSRSPPEPGLLLGSRRDSTPLPRVFRDQA